VSPSEMASLHKQLGVQSDTCGTLAAGLSAMQKGLKEFRVGLSASVLPNPPLEWNSDFFNPAAMDEAGVSNPQLFDPPLYPDLNM